MAYQAVLRVAPVKNLASLSGIEKHNRRDPNFIKGQSIRGEVSLDKTRSSLNISFVEGGVRDNAKALLDKYPMASSRGGNIAAEMILTAKVDYFDEISPEWRDGVYTDAFYAWVDANADFVKKEAGEGLVSLELHLDEDAPHFHAVIVPVATYSKSNKHGTEVEYTKIAYNRVFGDRNDVKKEARRQNNPELMRLGRLQTRYGDAMRTVDEKLIRGSKKNYNSNAKKAGHTTTQQFRKIVQREVVLAKVPDPVAVPSVSDIAKSKVPFVKTPSVDAFNSYISELREGLMSNGKAAKAYEAKAKSFDDLSAKHSQLLDYQARTEGDNMTLRKDLELSKEQVARVRHIDLDLVSSALSYSGEIKREWRNAIDLVKGVNKCDYKDACAWLYHEFGEDQSRQMMIASAIQKTERDFNIAKTSDKQPAGRREYAIQSSLRKQLDALDCSHYRLTYMSTNEDNPTNIDRDGDGDIRMYTKNDLIDIDMIMRIGARNRSGGYNIFITTADATHDYVLIDDMDEDKLFDLKNDYDIDPDYVQQTSDKNYQALIKIDRSKTTPKAIKEVVATLNAEYGDKAVTAPNHPFRLAGFLNMKPKHDRGVTSEARRPIVKVIKAQPLSDSEGINDMLNDIEASQDVVSRKTTINAGLGSISAMLHAQRQRTAESALNSPSSADKGKSIEIAEAHYRWIERKYGSASDLSTADHMLAKKLAKRGFDQNMQIDAIRSCSPNLDNRHGNDIERYLKRSVGIKERAKNDMELSR
jgi:hypothetical protein|tara:strand:- start:1483 stop:3750 length:2268 start_codon:yes stop_codon:yes gene_type:complete